jgi:enamine deaminase RidA (YjgF/YER057c/UK114 family)
LVAGTTATDENGKIVGPGDPYRQTVQTLKNIEKALARVGATLRDVVRTRLFVTDISRWESMVAPTGRSSRTSGPLAP